MNDALVCAAVNSIQLLHFMLVVTGAALLGMAIKGIWCNSKMLHHCLR